MVTHATLNVQLREQMEYASAERVSRYPQNPIGYRPSDPRDRNARTSRARPARSTPVHRPREKPLASVDSGAPVPNTADQNQAGYFLGVLVQYRRLLDQRIQKHRKTITRCEADGDLEGACAVRQLISMEQQDSQTVDGLIANLQRRFGAPAPNRARSVSQ